MMVMNHVLHQFQHSPIQLVGKREEWILLVLIFSFCGVKWQGVFLFPRLERGAVYIDKQGGTIKFNNLLRKMFSLITYCRLCSFSLWPRWQSLVQFRCLLAGEQMVWRSSLPLLSVESTCQPHLKISSNEIQSL